MTASNYSTQSRDTDRWAEELLFQRWRSMEPWQKAEIVSSMSRSLRELTLQGLRARLPDADRAELERRAEDLRLGADLAERARRRAANPG